MLAYNKSEARDWARAELRGVANVILPTFTNDLQGINEAAVRHDVRKEIELGFLGALMVAETATTPDEYVQFVEYAAGEAEGRLKLIFHASFNTLEENIALANRSAAAGAELVLLSYPPSFYPRSLDEVYDYTKAFCDAVDLGVILFPVPLWGFERLHAAAIPIDVLERLVDDVPNVVAIKAEGGYPHIGGFAECWNRLGDRVVVTMPIESEAIPLASLVPLQLIATSNTECLAGRVPQMLRLMQAGKHAEAMEIYWQSDPVRRGAAALGGVAGTNAVHRAGWKYQAWLNGFNGGPLRQPTQRLVGPQMQALRAAAVRAGLDVTTDDDAAFFVGRNPT